MPVFTAVTIEQLWIDRYWFTNKVIIVCWNTASFLLLMIDIDIVNDVHDVLLSFKHLSEFNMSHPLKPQIKFISKL